MTTTEPTREEMQTEALELALDVLRTVVKVEGYSPLIDLTMDNIIAALTSRPAPAAEVTGERTALDDLQDIAGNLKYECCRDGGNYWLPAGSRLTEDLYGTLLTVIERMSATPSPDAGRVPEGWQLVPKYPSEEISEAMADAYSQFYVEGEWAHIDPMYRAALAAAPQPNAKEEGYGKIS